MNDLHVRPTDRTDGSDRSEIRVGVSEYAVSTMGTPLATSGLGSCIGVALYDPATDIGGLGHVMLPTATMSLPKIGKFADTCVPALLDGMERAGCDPDRIRAKFAGGSSSMAFSAVESIGCQNAGAVRAALDAHGTPIDAEDIGGSHGRSLVFWPRTGTLEVNASNGNQRVL